MPHELFIPVGATAHVPVLYSYPQPLPAADPAYADMTPSPKDARVAVDDPAIEGSPAIVTAKLRPDGREIAIVGVEPGAAVVRIRAADGEDVINVTVGLLVPNGVSLHTDAVRYDLSKVAGPQPAPRHPADEHHPLAAPPSREPEDRKPAQPQQPVPKAHDDHDAGNRGMQRGGARPG